jgi:hypothetical protein
MLLWSQYKRDDKGLRKGKRGNTKERDRKEKDSRIGGKNSERDIYRLNSFGEVEF